MLLYCYLVNYTKPLYLFEAYVDVEREMLYFVIPFESGSGDHVRPQAESYFGYLRRSATLLAVELERWNRVLYEKVTDLLMSRKERIQASEAILLHM